MTKSKGILKRWTPDEVKLLREQYPHYFTHQVAVKLGRSIESVAQKASVLGLKKTPDFIDQEHIRITLEGRSTRFKKGSTPPNKGKKCLKK
jgi:hypothetical protein